MEILRASIFHTPANAFHHADALVAIEDGGLAIEDGRIALCAGYSTVAAAYPTAKVCDLRGGFIVPGFVDTHVHYPQIRIMAGLGYSLLDWLDQLTLPEEASLADVSRATELARQFVHALITHGTTTALVFGSHFAEATAALFTAAQEHGPRIISGVVMADRMLRPELHQTPIAAYNESRTLIERFHGRGLLSYAVTPRFALSASEAMLEVSGALLAEDPTLRFTTHINENPGEIAEVARLFPWAADYLAVYERYGLVGRQAVLAHSVHATDSELARLSARDASVAHCPSSNAALGSGIFPMQRHLDHGVRFALGTDIGAGVGFSVAREALQSYLMQRVATQPVTLTPAQMLYLATRAGAGALGLGDETGDFTAGKSADLVYLEPEPGSVLEGVMMQAENPAHKLAALLTLGGPECIRQVQVAGRALYAC